MVLDYHEYKPFTGRPMKGWKKDIEALEKRIEEMEKWRADVERRARKRKVSNAEKVRKVSAESKGGESQGKES